MRHVLSVSQVVRYIKSLVGDDLLLGDVYLKGEAADVRLRPSALYFTLRDERGDASVRCVMFAEELSGLRFTPENGMLLIVYGRAAVYERTGTLEIIAESLEPAGRGELLLALERLKEKLKKEGLFDSGRKRRIPSARHIALITSPSGAAAADFIKIAARRNPLVCIRLFPVTVQGGNAAPDICGAIALANCLYREGAYPFEVVVIARGGGAGDDLSAFNDEGLARAVAASVLPVVSAVGHETDITLCDLAADMRAETPSAAAELLTRDVTFGRDFLRDTLTRLNMRAANLIENEGEGFRRTARRLLERSEGAVAADAHRRAFEALNRAAAQRIRAWEDALGGAADILEKVSPLGVMRRGFSVAVQEGAVLFTAAGADMEKDITVKLIDGEITAKPKERRIDEYGEQRRV